MGTDISMVDIMKFFGMRPAEFRKEWNQLTDQDKTDLKAELANLQNMVKNEEERPGIEEGDDGKGDDAA